MFLKGEDLAKKLASQAEAECGGVASEAEATQGESKPTQGPDWHNTLLHLIPLFTAASR